MSLIESVRGQRRRLPMMLMRGSITRVGIIGILLYNDAKRPWSLGALAPLFESTA